MLMANFWRIVDRVIKESDVVLEVLDARMIKETRNLEIEEKVKKLGKRLIYVINKCDLADQKALAGLKRELTPSVFVSARERLGTTMLRNRILQVGAKLRVVVGVVGYPNTGKSSVINALAGRSKARTSPQPGFTKGLQLIRADNRIQLIDTPGVIPYCEDDEEKHALIAAADASRVREPELVAMQLIERLDGRVEKHYGMEKADDAEEALEAIAMRLKRLKAGGKPDTEATARMIIRSWQKGEITA